MTGLLDLFRGPQGAQRPYEAARRGRRLRSWIAPRSGPNVALGGDLEELRARSRDQLRNNPTAGSLADAFVSNLIGTGIKPLSKAESESLRDEIGDLWQEWCEVCDADGVLDFYGLQGLIARAWLEGGEVFVRLRQRRSSDELPVPMQLQIVEADLCPVSKNEFGPNGNIIKHGIEFDQLGRRVAYHMYRDHPHDRVGVERNPAGATQTTRVPAEEVLHIYLPTRPGQIRGEPRLTRSLVKMRDLDGYDDSELQRKKNASLFLGFVRRLEGEEVEIGVESEDYGEDDGPAGRMQTAEPGSLVYLEDGEDVTFAKPEDVGGMYEVYVRQQLRMIAASAGALYEQLTGDYSTVNDRTYRAAHNEMRRRMEMLQANVIVSQLCRPVWRRWITNASLIGAINLPAVPRRRRAATRVAWIPQAWRYIHPVQEVQAERDAVLAGFVSADDIIVERGGDPRATERAINDWNKRADRDGRSAASDPRSQAGPGSAEEVVSDTEAGEEDEVETSGSDPSPSSPSGSAPNATAPDQTDGGDSGVETETSPEAETQVEMSFELNDLGIAIRSGVLTAEESLEEAVRAHFGLPDMGPAVLSEWRRQPVRAPVTLSPTSAPGGSEAPASPAQENSEGSEDA